MAAGTARDGRPLSAVQEGGQLGGGGDGTQAAVLWGAEGLTATAVGTRGGSGVCGPPPRFGDTQKCGVETGMGGGGEEEWGGGRKAEHP